MAIAWLLFLLFKDYFYYDISLFLKVTYQIHDTKHFKKGKFYCMSIISQKIWFLKKEMVVSWFLKKQKNKKCSTHFATDTVSVSINVHENIQFFLFCVSRLSWVLCSFT